ncbi:RTA1-domain-containing protein [Laetiporus sulphureus 93-53]|uniref:RTA1-domain-containing protein n=1 Tax=Laetiporus sulphureus 93-53 TaxID=1314785 RepID=A0A165EXB2_9APHY|nr:RTA1-domain-containing protein [Laetiporus sulphureus 93-53]KZT07921.1 RTA1-domain-containing protein [Laetiporus sulphureus 93-53]
MSIEARSDQYSLTSPYGYTPDAWVGILFIVIFSLSTACHFVQAIYYRLWFMLPTAVLAGAIEIIGWGGRLWSSYNVLRNDPFLMQIVCTIIAPTPLVAASFIILGQIIHRLGQQYSRLSAKWYSIIFICCDIIALVIQGVGGGAASAAVNNYQSPTPGGHVMLAGIVFQLASISFYMLLAVEFIMRYLHDRPIGGRICVHTPYTFDSKLKQMVGALAFSSICIYIRSWYRTFELADGWDGHIITTQRYFVILDGMMIAFAMIAVNLFHPGRLLGPWHTWRSWNASAEDDRREQKAQEEPQSGRESAGEGEMWEMKKQGV